MLGALIGDIVGSRFAGHNHKDRRFVFFTKDCEPTADSKLILAVANAILKCGGKMSALAANAAVCMRDMGNRYPGGYGESFEKWLHAPDPRPYNSWGNGAAMRVSPCAWAAQSLEDALSYSDAVTRLTHNHPEGMKGARAVTEAIWLARNETPIEIIRKQITEKYYPLDFTIDRIRPSYKHDISCQGSVPQAIEAFLEADCFESAIRNAISIGGDSNTIAAITGSIAEAYYGVPEEMRVSALAYLNDELNQIVSNFETVYGMTEDKGFRPSSAGEKAARTNQQKTNHYKSMDSLKPVVDVVNEAAEALQDKERTAQDSPLNEVIMGAVGAGVGGAASFAALYGLGTVGLSAAGITSGLAAAGSIVGGGMAAGVFVLAAPAVLLAAAGVGVTSHIRAQQLQHEKERLYTETIRKQEAILYELEQMAKKAEQDSERIKYLEGLNNLLVRAIRELQSDLGVSGNAQAEIYGNRAADQQ